MEDSDDNSTEDGHDDSGISKKQKPSMKPSANFTKSTKFEMVCHDYILSKCPHDDTKSCKYTHPNIELLQHILQSAKRNKDFKTATEVQKKIDEITGKIVIGVLFNNQTFFETLSLTKNSTSSFSA